MLTSDSSQNRWNLRYWEYELGKSWAAEEVEIFSKNNTLFELMRKKVGWLLNRKLKELEILNDLVHLGNDLYELKIHISNNELRFLGVKEEDDLGRLPIFNVLLFFHKKDQKIKNKYLQKAKDRLKIYKNNNFK
ncbi:MAG: hypothetical protein WC241_03575 [Candidatus Paceibacterota bacterium]|jgi:hypothetical protein